MHLTLMNTLDQSKMNKSYYSVTKKGSIFGICASSSDEYICCNSHVISSVSNCPFSCTYCFLQNYLTDRNLTVISDNIAILDEIIQNISLNPWRFYRIGTWELGDSLALEDKTGSAMQLVKSFALLDNAMLELKTKSANVDNLLHLDHRHRTVVSWSMNPQYIISAEEHYTASLDQRLEAMKKVCMAGYLIGIHFDPMIYYENWKNDYSELLKMIFHNIPSSNIAWISIGSLRFNPEMKKTIEENHPESKITTAEMILGNDNKMRYVKPLRIELYSHIYDIIKELNTDDAFVYLCMERWDMWERIFKYTPRSRGHLEYLITESLHRRFKGLVLRPPELSRYVQ